MYTRQASWTTRLLSGGATRLLVLPLTALSSILVARLTIESTGIAMYGYVNLVAMLFQLLPFADFGVGARVSTLMARRDEDDDRRHEADVALISACRVLIVSSFLLIGLSVVLTPSGMMQRALGIPHHLVPDSALPILASLGFYLASVPFSLGLRVLIGRGATSAISLFGAIQPLCTLAFTALIAFTNSPPFVFAIAPGLAMLVTSICTLLYALRGISLAPGVLAISIVRTRAIPSSRVANTAWPMLVDSFAFAVAMHSHRILLANISTPEHLATYALAVQLFWPIWSIVHMSSNAMWSEFARNERQPCVWIQANVILLAIAVTGALGLLTLGPWVVSIMSNNAGLPTFPVLLAFGTLLVVLGMNSTQVMLLVSPRRLRVRAILAICWATTFFILAVPFTEHMQSAGPVWAMTISHWVVVGVPSLFLGHRITHVDGHVG